MSGDHLKKSSNWLTLQQAKQFSSNLAGRYRSSNTNNLSIKMVQYLSTIEDRDLLHERHFKFIVLCRNYKINDNEFYFSSSPIP